MKWLTVIFAALFIISCNGGAGAGSEIDATDSQPEGRDSGMDARIDTSAARFPTDTAPYKREPIDSMHGKSPQ